MKSKAPISDVAPEYVDPLTIEVGGIEHLPEVMRIMEIAFPKAFGESWNNNQSRSMLSLPGTELFLARFEQYICGFAICRIVASEEELLMIAVDPSYRQSGVATMMLQDIISKAKETGVEAIFLEVRSNNPAQILYERQGFEKIGNRAAYYTGEDGIKYDAITYRKMLKSGD